MILDLTPDNLKILNIEGFDFSQSTNDIIRNETIYACSIEKKIYTDIDCKRKMYFSFKGEKINSFPATCPQLFKEYFNLELNKFLELQKSLLLDGFNEVSQRKRFVNNQINLYTDSLEKNKTKLKNRPDAMRDVCEPIELYIMFCEDYEQEQYEAVIPNEELLKNEYIGIFKNDFGFTLFTKMFELYKNETTHLANFSFLFYAMEKDFLVCSQTDFVKFLECDNYNINIIKIDNRQWHFDINSTKKAKLYNSIKEQLQNKHGLSTI